jgi:hypothetical protein
MRSLPSSSTSAVPALLFALSAWAVGACGARTEVRSPMVIDLTPNGRRVVFVLDYSTTAALWTAENPSESSWQTAVRMTDTVAGALDDSVLVGGLVYPHPLGAENQSCRIDDSMFTAPVRGPESFVRLVRTFTSPAGASATFDALQRVIPHTGPGSPSVVVLFADGAPLCRREFDRAACRCLNTTGDCTSRNLADPAGLLWGCDDTERVVSAITALRRQGTAVFVAGAHRRADLMFPADLESLAAMARAAGAPGPSAPHPYYRTDVASHVTELRQHVLESLTTVPCDLRAAQLIPTGEFALVYDDARGSLVEIGSDRWRRVSESVISVNDRAVCGVPSLRRLRLVEVL